MKKHLSYLILAFSTVLLCMNIFGLFIPWENSGIYSTSFRLPPGGSSYTYKEAVEKLDSLEGTVKDIAGEANRVIYGRIVHYWDDQGIDDYHLRFPVYKNFILHLLSYYSPAVYKKYEFCDYHLALRRGVGLCSQQAIALVGYLESRGIKAKVVTLNGHVVAKVLVEEPDVWWIYDPDFGVVLPRRLADLEHSRDYISDKYVAAGISSPEAEGLAEIYTKTPNHVWEEGVRGYGDCPYMKYIMRKTAEVLVWVIPAFGLLIGILLLKKDRTDEKKA